LEQTVPASVSLLGAGWLGLPLGRFLLERGFSVLGSTTRTERLEEIRRAGIRPYLLELGELKPDDKAYADFFRSGIVVLTLPPGRKREDVEQRYPAQVATVLEAAVRGGVRRLLFTSSTGVYGNTNDWVRESDPANPTRAGGRALLAAEGVIRSQSELPATILRLAGLVGGDRQPGGFLAGRKDLPNGDAPVNLVHRDDCIRIIYEIIRQERWGEVYNVCADAHPKKRAFYPQQARALGLEPPTFQPGGPANYKIVSNEKVKRDLGYSFLYSNWGD